MHIHRRHVLTLSAAATATAAFGLSACSTEAEPGGEPSGDSGETKTVEITDNTGPKTVPVPPKALVATDNRLFTTLAAWDIPLVAAPVDLIAHDNPYKTDESVVNLGMHREPDLEAVVAVNPDVILNGQRFGSYTEDFATLVPDAVIVELDPREGEAFDAELRRQVETLGTILDRADDAKQTIADFDAAIAGVKEVYDPALTVLAVITSGGEINFSAPGSGRSLGPVFDILGLTPALEADGSSDHEGDDISVEAIAQSNPDVILVMDRDAALAANSGEEFEPANSLIANSEALTNVSAVKEGRIAYMPPNTYLDEGIQTYTEFFNSIAEVLA